MKTVLEPIPVESQADNSADGESLTHHQSSGPVFLVGMWRSGTSLFYALINQHPQIALMYEGDLLLLRPVFWLPGAKSRWLARWQFWNQAPTRHRLDIDRLTPSSSSFGHNIERAYRENAVRKGALIWGEKSPNYYDSLTRLARLFPEARFIVIWRDPAAICRSVVKAAKDPSSWFRRKGMLIRTLMGFKVMKTQCDQLLGRGVKLHQVQYEELIKDPTSTMTKVCSFLGVPFVPTMASLQQADRSAVYQGEHHLLVKGEDIVSARASERGEDLPHGVKSKIERYITLWRGETAGTWPQVPANCAHGVKPTWLERIVDQWAYGYYRTLDFGVTIVYAFAPLPLLKAWRERARGTKMEKSE